MHAQQVLEQTPRQGPRVLRPATGPASATRPGITPTDRLITKLVYWQRFPGAKYLVSPLLRAFGVNIPPAVPIGRDLRLPHCTTGLVLHPTTRVGARVTIFHNVTIGRADFQGPTGEFAGVTLEDDVLIGAGAAVLHRGSQPLTIGKRSVVGANTVLTHSIGPGEVWAGNPARRLR